MGTAIPSEPSGVTLIDFKLSRSAFMKTVNQLTKARASEADDLVDVTAYEGAVRFVVLGRETTVDAQVALRGAAQLPLSLLKRLGEVAKTFDQDTTRVRIENGRAWVNSMVVSNEKVGLERVLARSIDIPDDAPDRDLLALKYLFTPEQAAEANLTARLLAAHSRYLKVIDSCVKELSAYGIPPDHIKSIVDTALRSHAETLRPNLLPGSISTSHPN